MKTIKDDLTGLEHSKEENISVQVSFRNEGIFYKALMDVAPSTYMKLFGSTKVPFGKYIKHKTEEQKAEYNGQEGHYEPIKNGNSIIASWIEVPNTQ